LNVTTDGQEKFSVRKSERPKAVDDVDAMPLVTGVGSEAGADNPQLRAESLPRILRLVIHMGLIMLFEGLLPVDASGKYYEGVLHDLQG
jgi:hypothetical protein